MKTTTMKKAQLLTALTAVIMALALLGVFALTVNAAAADMTVTIDNGESVTLSDADGDGYYEIDSADQLYAFAAAVNGGQSSINGELTADIVVNENVLNDDGTLNGDGSDFRVWTPIAYQQDFKGTFEGNGYTVSGVYFNDSGADYVALIGRVESNGKVQNLGIKDSYFNAFDDLGTIVGSNYGTVINCYNAGSVIDCDSSYYTGGVVGYNGGTVENCFNTGSVRGDGYAGGIVGGNSGTVKNCYNIGKIYNYYDGAAISSENYGAVENCYYLDTCGVRGVGISKNAEAFASGEVAYLLGEAFGQDLSSENKDEHPVFRAEDGSNQVYPMYVDCNTSSYSNDSTASNEKPDHSFGDDGFCVLCDEYQAAVRVTADNFASFGLTADYIDAYAIANAGQLYWFAQRVNGGNSTIHAVLTADIVVNEGVLVDGALASDNSDFRVWTPIGTDSFNFRGVFDGNGHTVSGLYFNDSDAEKVGFVGCMSEGTVKNLGIIDSYFCARVYIGGLVGFSRVNTTITNCYNQSFLKGSTDVGGIVGYNLGKVENCYNIGSVNCNFNNGGAVVGLNGEIVKNCYYLDTCGAAGDGFAKSAEAFASGEVAYLLGNTFGQKLDGENKDAYPVFLTKDGSNQVYRQYGLTCASVSYSNSSAGNNVQPNHVFGDNGFCELCNEYQGAVQVNTDNYAMLGLTTDYIGYYAIGNAGQLYWFAAQANNGDMRMNAVLIADIVVNENVLNDDGTLNGDGSDFRIWTPIGNRNQKYVGVFDGNGYAVSGLYFNNSSVEYIGLFGGIGQDGSVKNVGVEDSYFCGERYVGSVSGYVFGNGWSASVMNCYSTSTLNGTSDIGGIVGMLELAYIVDSYNTGVVSGSSGVGGIVGFAYTSCHITNCYNVGTVNGRRDVGGVLGENSYSYVENSYYLNTCGAAGEGIAKSAEAFASGEVAYLLNGSTFEGDLAWKQNLGQDDIPGFNGSVVAYYTKEDVYTNHIHQWEYTKNENVIYATCANEDCTYHNGNGGTLTLIVPENAVYTGTAFETSYVYSTDWYFEQEDLQILNWYTADANGEYVIADNIVDAGYYMAEITFGDCTVSVAYTVEKTDTPIPVLDAMFGQTLADIALPEGWSWVSASDNVGELGSHTHLAVYAGTNNYKAIEGEVALTVNVAPKTIGEDDVTVSDDVIYNGTEQNPVIKVIVPGMPDMILGSDYTVSYTRNGEETNNFTNAGEIVVTVTGIGNYDGVVTKVFTIGKATANIKVESPVSCILPGGAVILTVTSDVNGLGDPIVTVINGTSDGLKIVANSGLIVGQDQIEITVTYEDTENYLGGTETVILKVGMDDVLDQMTEIEQDIKDLNDMLDNKANAEEISQKIEGIQKKLSALEAADGQIGKDLSAAIAKAEDDLLKAEEKLEQMIADVQSNLEQATDELEQAIANGDKALDDKIANLNAALEAAKAALAATDADAKAELVSKIESADAALQTAIDALSAELGDVKSDLGNVKTELEQAKTELGNLQTLIVIVCIISGVTFAGFGAFVIWFVIDKKKKI